MRRLPTAGSPSPLRPEEVDRLVPRIAEVCRKAPVLLAYLHGAHARGTQGPLSDIDIAVLLEEGVQRDVHLHLDLLASLEKACAREEVDLVVLNTAGTIIKDRVVRDGRLVYARTPRDRVRFEAAAIKEALDFQHFSRVYNDALFERLAEGRFLD